MSIPINLEDQKALVTGAGAGIGREIAIWLAKAGATVVVNDLVSERAESVVKEITESGSEAFAIPADCRDDTAVDQLVNQSLEIMGGLSIAVNNVGMLPPNRGLKSFVE